MVGSCGKVFCVVQEARPIKKLINKLTQDKEDVYTVQS